MANEKNLTPNSKRTPSERRENARKAGIASGEARRKNRDARQTLELINSLAVQGKNRDLLERAGLPKNALNQQTARLWGLHTAATAGNVQANRLILEILGELTSKPTTNSEDVGFAFKIEDCSGEGDNE